MANAVINPVSAMHLPVNSEGGSLREHPDYSTIMCWEDGFCRQGLESVFKATTAFYSVNLIHLSFPELKLL